MSQVTTPPRASYRVIDIDRRILEMIPCTFDELFPRFGRRSWRKCRGQILILRRHGWIRLEKDTDGKMHVLPGVKT